MMAALDFPSSPTSGQIYDTGLGPKYVWDDTAWNLIQTMAGLAYRERVYTASGTWSKPSDLVALDVTLVGGGGGGGGASATGASSASAGSGGGGGAVVKKSYRPDDLAATEAYVVGAGGASTAPGAASTFKGLTAGGGAAGTTLNGAAYTATGTALGGIPAGNGDINLFGGDGGAAYIQSPAGWAKAGEGGGNALASLRTAGPTPGQGGAKTGNSPGCGGSGAALGANQALIAGGAGANGILILREWYTAKPVITTIAAPHAETRNRLTNPAMQHSQENGDTVSTTGAYYPADQWLRIYTASTPVYTGRTGNSIFMSTGTPFETAATGSEYAFFRQIIEGSNLADFNLGTANSEPFVIAFSVNIPVAGTYWIGFQTAGATHTYLAAYTISAAEVGTWVRKTVAVPRGAINAGTWPTNIAACAALHFIFHCGPTYIGVPGLQAGNFLAGPGQALGISTSAGCSMSNAGLYLDPDGTGVAPPWQMPDFGEELARCQRYWHSDRIDFNAYSGGPLPDTRRFGFPTSMRTVPIMAESSITQGNCTLQALDSMTTNGFRIWVNVTAAGSFYRSSLYTANARM